MIQGQHPTMVSKKWHPPSRGPPVERLEAGYPLSVVYSGRGTLPQERARKGTTGGPRSGEKEAPQVWDIQ